MFACEALFLAATILSANLVLANILVQPGYEHQYRSNQHNPYHQPVLQYSRMPSPAERYHAEQLTSQQLPQHHTGMYPYYKMYHNPAPSNWKGFPIFHQSHHSTLLEHADHFHHVNAKNNNGNARPLTFVGYPYPLTVHHQYRRSCKSDPTGIESKESTTAKHEDDVATKPSISDANYSTGDGTLLPENEPTDPNEKRVENRQSKNEHAITGPFLFGLNPERMYPRYRQVDATKQSLLKPVPISPSVPSILNERSATNFVQSIEPTQILSTTSQKREQDQGKSYVSQEDDHIRNTSSKDFEEDYSENSTAPIQTTSSDNESSDEEVLSAEPESVMIIKIPCVNCNQSPSFVLEFGIADLEASDSDTDPVTGTRHDEVLPGSDKIISWPNSDTVGVPFTPSYVLSNNDIAPFESYYGRDCYRHYHYPYSSNPDYVIDKNTYVGDNLPSMDTMTLLDVSRMRQFSDTYNYPTKPRYVPLPKARKYYYVTPATSYSHVPLYRRFSSPAYY